MASQDGEEGRRSPGRQPVTLGEYLRELREGMGVTLRSIESDCQISNGYLSLLENDKVKDPSPKFLWALAQRYEADYLDMMRRAGYPVPVLQRAAVTFRGADRLDEQDRREVQALIDAKLRRRRAEADKR